MTDRIRIKSQLVLSWASEGHDGVVFNNEDEDTPGDMVTIVSITPDDWSDMGEPREITVTIEPGDTLNVGIGGKLVRE